VKNQEFLTAKEIAEFSGHATIVGDARPVSLVKLWWRRLFPPKHWIYKCANCGEPTADPGYHSEEFDFTVPSYCSRKKCTSVCVDHHEKLLDEALSKVSTENKCLS